MYVGNVWVGRALMISGVAVFFLGGVHWPPAPISLTSTLAAVALLGWGATLDNRFTAQRMEQKHAALRARHLGDAFTTVWPEAPDRLKSWTLGLNDAALADLHAWLMNFGERPGVNDLMTTRMAPGEVKATLAALDDDQRRQLQEILERA